MRVRLRNPDREMELTGARPVRAVLAELSIDPDTVLVIRGRTLLTRDEWLEPADEIEVRPVISGGSGSKGLRHALQAVRLHGRDRASAAQHGVLPGVLRTPRPRPGPAGHRRPRHVRPQRSRADRGERRQGLAGALGHPARPRLRRAGFYLGSGSGTTRIAPAGSRRSIAAGRGSRVDPRRPHATATATTSPRRSGEVRGRRAPCAACRNGTCSTASRASTGSMWSRPVTTSTTRRRPSGEHAPLADGVHRAAVPRRSRTRGHGEEGQAPLPSVRAGDRGLRVHAGHRLRRRGVPAGGREHPAQVQGRDEPPRGRLARHEGVVLPRVSSDRAAHLFRTRGRRGPRRPCERCAQPTTGRFCAFCRAVAQIKGEQAGGAARPPGARAAARSASMAAGGRAGAARRSARPAEISDEVRRRRSTAGTGSPGSRRAVEGASTGGRPSLWTARAGVPHQPEAGGTFHFHGGAVAHDLIGGRRAWWSVRHRRARLVALRPTAGRLRPEDASRRTGHLPEGHRRHPGARRHRARSAGAGGGHRARARSPLALARAVGPTGRVVSYEPGRIITRPRCATSRRSSGSDPQWVDLRLGDVDERRSTRRRVRPGRARPARAVGDLAGDRRDDPPGGILCSYLPTTNQTQTTVLALGRAGYLQVDTFEVLVRHWHVTDRSVRPDHRMVAHTGFITTGRKGAGRERPAGTRRRTVRADRTSGTRWSRFRSGCR